MHACLISSVFFTMLPSPIRCENVVKADSGGFWRFAQVSGEKKVCELEAALKRDSFGGNWRRDEADVDAICAALDAKLFTACTIETRLLVVVPASRTNLQAAPTRKFQSGPRPYACEYRPVAAKKMATPCIAVARKDPLRSPPESSRRRPFASNHVHLALWGRLYSNELQNACVDAPVDVRKFILVDRLS